MYWLNSISMAKNYKERVVDNYSKNDVIIDTVWVDDSEYVYETGICHPRYNNGNWIIVETCDTIEEAQEGHNKWVKIMTADKLPDKIIDKSAEWGDEGREWLRNDDVMFEE